MAIWQVSISLIKTDDFSGYKGREQLNGLNELSVCFPEEKSWCKSIIQFGKLDSTCIEIYIGENVISLRVDLRSVTQQQLETIIRFAISNELKIKYQNITKEPSFVNFIEIFISSDAYRFVNNPTAFLGRTKEDNNLVQSKRDN